MRSQWLELFPIGDPLGRRILFDPVSAITGGVGLVGNLVGGLIGKSTADNAGKIQQQAAATAGKNVTDAVAAANPQIGAAADTAGKNVTSAADIGAADTASKAEGAAEGVNRATGQANAILDPYSQTGQNATKYLDAGLAPGGDFNKAPTLKDIQIDPGYAYRQQQAEEALSRGSAARGTATSGAALKALNAEVQGNASQEYSSAFQRFEQDRQNRFANLSTTAGQGIGVGENQGANLTAAARYGGDVTTGAAQFGAGLKTGAATTAGGFNTNAADLMAANTIGGAKTAADYLTGGANAAAASKIAGANAITGAISGGVNSVTNAALLSKLKNPAVNIGGRP